MAKIELSENQKKLDIDLWIIMIVSFACLMTFMVFQEKVYGIVKNEELPILSRVLLTAFFQYGVAGLGITIVSILRKASLTSDLLSGNKILPSFSNIIPIRSYKT